MATPEQKFVQRHLHRIINFLTRLKFIPFTQTKHIYREQTDKWGHGRTVTCTTHCDRLSKWSQSPKATSSFADLLSAREVKSQIKSLSLTCRCMYTHITIIHTRVHRTTITPVCTQTPEASLHWQVSGCPCRQKSVKDAEINLHSYSFVLPFTSLHMNTFISSASIKVKKCT